MGPSKLMTCLHRWAGRASREPSLGSCCPTKAGCVSERKKKSSDSLLNSRSKPELVLTVSQLGLAKSRHECSQLQSRIHLQGCCPQSRQKWKARMQTGRCSGVIVRCAWSVCAPVHSDAPTSTHISILAPVPPRHADSARTPAPNKVQGGIHGCRTVRLCVDVCSGSHFKVGPAGCSFSMHAKGE